MSQYPFNQLKVEILSEKREGSVINVDERFTETFRVTNLTQAGISFKNIILKIKETEYARPDLTEMLVPTFGLESGQYIDVAVGFTALKQTPIELAMVKGIDGMKPPYMAHTNYRSGPIAIVNLEADAQMPTQNGGTDDQTFTGVIRSTSSID